MTKIKNPVTKSANARKHSVSADPGKPKVKRVVKPKINWADLPTTGDTLETHGCVVLSVGDITKKAISEQLGSDVQGNAREPGSVVWPGLGGFGGVFDPSQYLWPSAQYADTAMLNTVLKSSVIDFLRLSFMDPETYTGDVGVRVLADRFAFRANSGWWTANPDAKAASDWHRSSLPGEGFHRDVGGQSGVAQLGGWMNLSETEDTYFYFDAGTHSIINSDAKNGFVKVPKGHAPAKPTRATIRPGEMVLFFSNIIHSVASATASKGPPIGRDPATQMDIAQKRKFFAILIGSEDTILRQPLRANGIGMALPSGGQSATNYSTNLQLPVSIDRLLEFFSQYQTGTFEISTSAKGLPHASPNILPIPEIYPHLQICV